MEPRGPLRSIADALRQFAEPELEALLTDRPDLCAPPPSDLADLAGRASTATSVRRAIDTLTRPELAAAEALAALPRCTVADLSALLDDADAAVDRLRALALVWGAPELQPVRGLRQVFEPFPGGLAEPSAHPLDTAAIETALTGLPATARAVLEKLQWGPPTGAVRHADRRVTDPVTPIDHLLERGLLRAHDAHTVVLPREVALHVRGGFLREPLVPPPQPAPGRRANRIIDSAAIGAAYEFVHELEGLLDDLGRRAPAPLRTGGLAARDLAAIARAVGAPLDRTSFLLEVAYAAGLLAISPAIVPTEAFDRWLTLPLGPRYAQVLRAWYASARWPAASRAPRGHALTPEAEAGWATDARRAVLGTLAPADAVDPDTLVEAARWERPALSRVGDPADLTAAVLAEAAWLGLTALDQGSALLAGLTGELSPATLAQFPDLVDQLVLQTDLTAVATGPLDRRTGSALGLLADVESRGGGGVFRFSAASLRRAFDAGWSAGDIEEWLAAHSRTGVPQPLRYLVGDVARLHGTVRVGAARAYIRIDDPARIRTVLAHPDAADHGLRQIGPETLVADADPAEVVALLRALGLTPAAENAAGQVLSAPPPRRPAVPPRGRPQAPDPARVAAALVARRAAHQLTLSTEESVGILARAAEGAQPVEVDYVAADGTRASAMLVPLELSAGMVRLSGAGTAVSLPLARVTSVRWPQDGLAAPDAVPRGN